MRNVQLMQVSLMFKSCQCAVFCSVSCHVIELPIAPHFINRKMIIATFYLLLSALKVGFRWILGRFKVGYYRKRRSPLGRFFWIFWELTPATTLAREGHWKALKLKPLHRAYIKVGWKVCRVTMAHLRLRVTVGHPMVTIYHLGHRLIIGYLRAIRQTQLSFTPK